jgi:ribosomal protein S18 acetylase RimI-like enzyme
VANPATRVNVRRITPQDAWEAAYVLAASHADYPAFRHAFPNPRQRQRVVRELMTAAARDVERRGVGYLARVRGIAAGAALWFPPGTPDRGGWDTARIAVSMLPVALAGRGRFLAFARVEAALEEEARDEDGWYLQTLGVTPRHQGRGIGARLLAPVLEAADSHGVTCGLHTSDPANVGFYERAGFEVIEPLHAVTPGGPAYLRMRRQPQ